MKGEQKQNKKKNANGNLRFKIAKICAAVNFAIFVLVIIFVISSNKKPAQTAPPKSHS